MKEDLFFALALFLLADELERVTERPDGRLERRFDFTALHPHAVDLALHVFQPRLRLLQQQLGPSFGLANNLPGLRLGIGADVLGDALCRHHRVAKIPLVLAMLVEQRFHFRDFLAQTIDIAKRVFVVVGHFGDERHHFGFVETAKRRAESQLAEIERADLHAAFSSGRGSCARSREIRIKHGASRRWPCRAAQSWLLPARRFRNRGSYPWTTPATSLDRDPLSAV